MEVTPRIEAYIQSKGTIQSVSFDYRQEDKSVGIKEVSPNMNLITSSINKKQPKPLNIFFLYELVFKLCFLAPL